MSAADALDINYSVRKTLRGLSPDEEYNGHIQKFCQEMTNRIGATEVPH